MSKRPSKEMKKLERSLKDLSVSRRPRSRSRKRSRSRRPSRSRSRGPGNVNRPPPNMTLSAGEICVSMSELLFTLTNGTTVGLSKSISMRPGGANNSAGHLAALAKIYKRYKYTRLELEYTGCVGTTVGGIIAMGYEYDKPTLPSGGWTWAQVTANSPNKQVALFKSCRIKIPIAKMNPQRWFETDGSTEAHPGALLIKTDGGEANQSVGYVRVHYTIHFAGPNL